MYTWIYKVWGNLSVLELKQKDRQALQHEISGRVLKALSSLLASAGIEFATAHNALYGVREFTAILALMAKLGVSAREAVKEMDPTKRCPSSRWFLYKFHSMEPEEAWRLCEEMLKPTIKIALRACRRAAVLIAIDKHLIPRHDRSGKENLVRSEAKGGTTWFESYATMQIVDGPINAVLCCLREIAGTKDIILMHKFTQFLAENGVKVRLLLLDRGFYSVDVMEALNQARYRFLMPAVKNRGIQKAIMEYHKEARKAVSRYEMKNKHGRSVRFTLVITRSDLYGRQDVGVLKWYVAFATNLPPRRALKEIHSLPEYYGKRWGIETGYRQIESARPRTTSLDPAYRALLFFTALFIYNTWAVERNSEVLQDGYLTLRLLASLIETAASGQLALISNGSGEYG